jgi:DNA-binding NtrC family response regulator
MNVPSAVSGSRALLAGHIFLVEDDDDLRESIIEILSFVGYRVYPYRDPQEFLDGFIEVIPAVVVTDVRMPSMSGIELQTKLLNQGRKIPFVFISGESTVPQASFSTKKIDLCSATALAKWRSLAACAARPVLAMAAKSYQWREYRSPRKRHCKL